MIPRETLRTSLIFKTTKIHPCYAFAVDNKKQENIEVTVGGCKLIVDSGASTNIIDKQTQEWLKNDKVKCKSSRSDKKSTHMHLRLHLT